MRYTQHTSESVSDGHPDKIADQISDAVLDAVLAQDRNGRVACEVLVKAHTVMISGEITANAKIDYMTIVCEVLSHVYDREVAPDEIELITRVGEQSLEIASGVDHDGWIGAGDQGIMYGYACDETSSLMPLPIYLAHQLMIKHRQVRVRQQDIKSDAKCQVTVQYEEGSPKWVSDVVFSTQHSESLVKHDLEEIVLKEIIQQVIPNDLLKEETNFWINNIKF